MDIPQLDSGRPAKLRARSLKNSEEHSNRDAGPVWPSAKFSTGAFERLLEQTVVQKQSEVRLILRNERDLADGLANFLSLV